MWFKKWFKEEKLEKVSVYEDEPYQGRTFEKFKESQELPDKKTVFLDLVSSFRPELDNVDALMDEIELHPVGMNVIEHKIELVSEGNINDFVTETTIDEMSAVLLNRSDYLYSNWYSVDLDGNYALEGLVNYNSDNNNIKIYLVARTKERQENVVRYRNGRTGR